MADTRILILGGVFAGATLACELEKRLPGSCQITLVSRNDHITNNLLLAEVVGASILSGHMVTPRGNGRTRHRQAGISRMTCGLRICIG
jgi:NADH dehydrogenase FAD-containing subunit